MAPGATNINCLLAIAIFSQIKPKLSKLIVGVVFGKVGRLVAV